MAWAIVLGIVVACVAASLLWSAIRRRGDPSTRPGNGRAGEYRPYDTFDVGNTAWSTGIATPETHHHDAHHGHCVAGSDTSSGHAAHWDEGHSAAGGHSGADTFGDYSSTDSGSDSGSASGGGD